MNMLARININNIKIGFIGAGHMCQMMVQAFIQSGRIQAQQISVSNRSEGKLMKLADQWGIRACRTNEEVVDSSQVVILAVKPQDMDEALESVSSSFDSSHLVLSIAAGLNLQFFERRLSHVPNIARVMPSTPMSVGKGVIGYCLSSRSEGAADAVERLLAPLGYVVRCEEGEAFRALTVGCASGPGFIFELMLYWQEWLEEHGFETRLARQMTAETFLGAASLAQIASRESSFQDLQGKVVTSKKGVTAAGLQSMQELEIERALRYSFEKSVMRDQELGREK